jgi:DNA-binding transcriptional ArsR family regulator
VARSADYEAEEVLVVSEPERMRALADELRIRIVTILRDRAASTTELAERLELPKGTVGHHLKVLEKAGLVRVVRTRKVRALTEKYYGRTARLFIVKSGDEPVEGLPAVMLRRAAEEAGDEANVGLVHARLSPADARRFERRLEKLLDDFQAREAPDGEPFGLVVGFYHGGSDA